MDNRINFWPPIKDQTIRTCLDMQYSTYQIARKLKCSQGAVARRIRKLGLKPAFGAPDMGSTFKRATVEKALKKERKQRDRPVAIEAIQPSSTVDDSVSALFAGVGIALAVARDGLCRWPYDGGSIAQPRVCGEASADKVYCPKHNEIATRGARRAEDKLLNYNTPYLRSKFI